MTLDEIASLELLDTYDHAISRGEELKETREIYRRHLASRIPPTTVSVAIALAKLPWNARVAILREFAEEMTAALSYYGLKPTPQHAKKKHR